MDYFDETISEPVGGGRSRGGTAVLARDRRRDGAFVYAVRSTGIYCRPSCTSRRPRRDRVAFFDTPDAGARGRFPRLQALQPDTSRRRPIRGSRRSAAPACISRTSTAIRRWPRWRRASAAARITCSATSSGIVGVTPREYADAIRLRKVKGRLRQRRRHHRRDARRRATDRAAASTSAPRRNSGWRRRSIGAAGPACRSATRSSIRRTRRSGRLLVAATARGVCAVAMGSSDDELTARAGARVSGGDDHRRRWRARAWTRAILAHLSGRQPRLDLPLDVQATAFQWQVWEALAAIPYGETRTYGDVADVDRPAARGARRRARLRDQSGGAGHPVPSRRAARAARAVTAGVGEEEGASQV